MATVRAEGKVLGNRFEFREEFVCGQFSDDGHSSSLVGTATGGG